MSILHDPGQPLMFVPSSEAKKPEGQRVTYMLRVPSVTDKPLFRHAVIMAGGHSPLAEHSMLVLMRAELGGLLAGDGDAELLAELGGIIDARADAIVDFVRRREAGEFETDAERNAAYAEMVGFVPDQRLADIERMVMMGSVKYATRVADNMVYPDIAGLVAARMFLIGWYGVEAEFAHRPRMPVSDALLGHVEPAHLIEIGREIESLLELTEAKRKNLLSPPSTRSEAATSTAGSTPPKKARSKTTGGTSRPSISD